MELDEHADHYDLTWHVELLEDSKGTLSIADVSSWRYRDKFRRPETHPIRLGFSRSTYWIRFTLKNSSLNTRPWILEQRFNNTHSLTLYLPDGEGGFISKNSGNLLPWKLRDIPHRRLAFRIEPPHQDTTYYLRLRSNASLIVDLHLWSSAGFLKSEIAETRSASLFYGAMIMMLGYHILLYGAVREKVYLWLALCIGLATLTQSIYDGHIQEIDHGLWAHILALRIPAFTGLLFISLLMFIGDFCSPPHDTSISRFHRTLGLAWAISIILSFVLPYGVAIQTEIGLIFVTVGYIAFRGSRTWQRLRLSNRIFVIAFFLMMVSTTPTLLAHLGWDQIQEAYSGDMRIGIIWMMLALSAATADRIITLKKETSDKNQALHDSESQFQQLVENIREVFWLGAPDWSKIYYINPAYEEIWGHPCKEIYESPFSWFEYVHPDDKDMLKKALNESAQGITQKTEFPEYRIVRPDGTVRWILARAFPIKDAAGRTVRIAGFAEDITERKAAEMQRLKNEKAQKDALVREVHHRIKNNLQGVVGLLREGQRKYPEMREAVERVITRIRSIATVHGLHAREPGEEIALADLVEAIAQVVEHINRGRIHVILGEPMEWQPCLREEDAVAVALIINELLVNALKHTQTEQHHKVIVTLFYKADMAELKILNPESTLPPGFDLKTGRRLGTGLELVRALLPRTGASLEIRQTEDGVLAELIMTTPLIKTRRPMGEISKHQNDTRQADS